MGPSRIASTLAVAASLALAGCGSDASDVSGGASAGNGTDRAFAAEMIPHHESAVAMAKVAQERGESPFVRELADQIARTQETEIVVLRREDAALAADGVKRGSLGFTMDAMGMHMDTADGLRTAKPFDAAFLKEMVPHHQGAIVMARAELAKGRDPELRELASAIMAAQQREISEMKRALSS